MSVVLKLGYTLVFLEVGIAAKSVRILNETRRDRRNVFTTTLVSVVTLLAVLQLLT